MGVYISIVARLLEREIREKERDKEGVNDDKTPCYGAYHERERELIAICK
jgi:hypothetical protein